VEKNKSAYKQKAYRYTQAEADGQNVTETSRKLLHTAYQASRIFLSKSNQKREIWTMDSTTQHTPPLTPRPRRWANEKQAAEYLGSSTNFLAKDRITRLLAIPFYRMGRHIRYDLDELDEFIEASRNEARPKKARLQAQDTDDQAELMGTGRKPKATA
jgi:excisionase family DNA binding protein